MARDQLEQTTVKWAIAVFLVAASTLAVFLAYDQAEKAEQARVDRAEARNAREFRIPDAPSFADPQEMYSLLRGAASSSRVNVFRSSVAFDVNDRVVNQKYVLLTGPTRYFDSFKLRSGRWLTARDTQQTTHFVSTVDTGEHDQVGTAVYFGGRERIVFKPLKASYDYLPAAGQYYVEASGAKREAFLQRLAASATAHFGKSLKRPLVADDFRAHRGAGGIAASGSSVSLLNAFGLLVLLITVVLILYYMFYASRRIGIMKMHGMSGVRVWFILIGRLVCIAFVTSLAAAVVIAVRVEGATVGFVAGTSVALIRTYGAVAASSLVAYVYIRRVKVGDAIKNREDTRGIFVLNTLIKAGFSVALILLAASIWEQHDELLARQESAGNWERSKDYGVFYPLSVGHDLEDIASGSRGLTVAICDGLYPLLNSEGALYVDAAEYEGERLAAGAGPQTPRSIQVNPNYLKRYPLRDVRGRPVAVPEDTSDWVLLVPERYRGDAARITRYFRRQRADTRRIEKARFGRSVPMAIRSQSVRIVWMASGQKAFSFDPLVFPADHSLIADPIVQVMTIRNSLTLDRVGALKGAGGGDALKMRLAGRDTRATFAALQPDLKRLGLDDNIRYLVTINQFILQEARSLQRAATDAVLVSLGIGLLVLLLVVQNLVILFERYQRAFVVRRLFGTGFVRSYREHLILFSALWALQALACLGARWITGGGSSPGSSGPVDLGKLAAIAAALVLAELAGSCVVLGAIEKRSRVRVLKGGI